MPIKWNIKLLIFKINNLINKINFEVEKLLENVNKNTNIFIEKNKNIKNKLEEKKEQNGFIYILQLREFIKNKEFIHLMLH